MNAYNLNLAILNGDGLFLGLPEFMWNGIFKLLISVLGGIIVASFTTLYLNKKNEVIRVTGILVERRIEIYRKLLSYLDNIGQKMYLPGMEADLTIKLLKERGFDLPNGNLFEYSRVFETCENFDSFFLDLERIILEDKLFLDDDSVKELYYIQSYFALINGLYVSIEKCTSDMGVKTTPEKLKSTKSKFLKTLGVIIDDEISNLCIKSESIFVENIRDIKLERRSHTFLTKDFFMGEDGYVMSRLKKSVLLKNQKQVMDLMIDFIEYYTVVDSIKSPEIDPHNP